MALIIKADMPEGCAYCFAYDDEYCLCRLEPSLDGHWRRDNHCPIIGEIPDEHGRLVDLDSTLECLYEKYCRNNCQDETCDNCILSDVITFLENAPVIVEASTSIPN